MQSGDTKFVQNNFQKISFTRKLFTTENFSKLIKVDITYITYVSIGEDLMELLLMTLQTLE